MKIRPSKSWEEEKKYCFTTKLFLIRGIFIFIFIFIHFHPRKEGRRLRRIRIRKRKRREKKGKQEKEKVFMGKPFLKDFYSFSSQSKLLSFSPTAKGTLPSTPHHLGRAPSPIHQGEYPHTKFGQG